MRALDPEVADVIWQTVEPLLPPPDRSHPLGCHRPKASDRLCFRGLLIRLVTGSSWVDIEAILDHQVSDTTLRARRDQWIDASVFDALKPKHSPYSTGSSAPTLTTSPSTARCTRRRAAAKEPAQPHGSSEARAGRDQCFGASRHPARLGHRRGRRQRRRHARTHTLNQA